VTSYATAGAYTLTVTCAAQRATSAVTVEPKESPIMDGITDAQFSTLLELRRHYPETMSPEQTGDMLNRWTWTHRADGLGMQSKPSGTHAILPNGTPVWNGVRGRNAAGQFFGQDVLGAASIGLNTPVRGEAVEIRETDPPFVAPIDPGGVIDPPDDSDHASILELQVALKLLAGRVSTLEAALEQCVRRNELPDLTTVAHRGDPVTVGVRYLGPAHGTIDHV
jgi:hypothetical protein